REKLAGSWVTWPFQVPLSLAVPDGFGPVDHIADVAPIPTLLIAGEADTTVPAHHSERLQEAAGEPVDLWLLPETDHTAALARADVRDRLVAWLDAVLEDE
ncbi:MAG: prolyl oligopeptidase family serine peptidase, partial [Ectothiorhodospiraceae bacterium]